MNRDNNFINNHLPRVYNPNIQANNGPKPKRTHLNHPIASSLPNLNKRLQQKEPNSPQKSDNTNNKHTNNPIKTLNIRYQYHNNNNT